MGSVSACQARSVTSNSACSRFDAVSSGPKTRNVSMLSRITSRSHVPSTRIGSFVVVAGARHVDRVVAEVGEAQVLQQLAAVGVRDRAHPALARPAPAR